MKRERMGVPALAVRAIGYGPAMLDYRPRICALLALLAALACAGGGYAQYLAAVEENRSRLNDLELGMDRAAVDSVLGNGLQFEYKKLRITNPWRVDAFELKGGTAVRIQYYLTQRQRRTGEAREAELTPVVFEDGRVVGWGWSYLRRMTDRYGISAPLEQK